MYNDKTNSESHRYHQHYTAITIGLTCLIPGITACGPSEEEQRHSAAVELSTAIDSAISGGRFVEAISLIDSLNSAYPDEIDLRRATLLSRARAMEGMILDSIPVYDAALNRVQLETENLSRNFVKVSVPGLEAYEVDRDVADNAFTSHTTIQPRLGDDQIPWTIAVNIAGRKPGIKGLILKADGMVVAEVHATNSAERRVVGDSGEMFSFGPEESWKIADAMAGLATDAPKLTLTVTGEKSNVDFAVNNKLRKAIERTARMARLKGEDHYARVQRELMERKLIVARDQIANFTDNQQTAPAPEAR